MAVEELEYRVFGYVLNTLLYLEELPQLMLIHTPRYSLEEQLIRLPLIQLIQLIYLFRAVVNLPTDGYTVCE